VSLATRCFECASAPGSARAQTGPGADYFRFAGNQTLDQCCRGPRLLGQRRWNWTVVNLRAWPCWALAGFEKLVEFYPAAIEYGRACCLGIGRSEADRMLSLAHSGGSQPPRSETYCCAGGRHISTGRGRDSSLRVLSVRLELIDEVAAQVGADAVGICCVARSILQAPTQLPLGRPRAFHGS